MPNLVSSIGGLAHYKPVRLSKFNFGNLVESHHNNKPQFTIFVSVRHSETCGCVYSFAGVQSDSVYLRAIYFLYLGVHVDASFGVELVHVDECVLNLGCDQVVQFVEVLSVHYLRNDL